MSDIKQIGKINYIYTPWDTSVLGLKTIEITKIDTTDFTSLVEDLNALKLAYPKHMLYGRFSATNTDIKHLFLQAGFYIAEHSAIVMLTRLDKREISYKREISSNKIVLSVGESADYPYISEIAKTSFRFSRFHEDPFIQKELSNQRTANWVMDMQKQSDVKCLLYKQNNQIISFLLYKQDNNVIDLLLAGGKEGYGYVIPYFWQSFLLFFQKSEVKKIKTRISLSNVGIANIYFSLGFSIKTVDFDYHLIPKNH